MLYRKIALLVAGAAVASAGVTTSTAETSYPVPSIVLSSGDTVASTYDVGNALNTKFKIYETLDFGYLNDWSNGYLLYRGAGGLCSLANRNIWFTGQTKVLNKNTGKTLATLDSSATIATKFDHAWTLDFTSNLTTGLFNPIPYTLNELDDNTHADSKVVLSAHTNCVPVSDTEAAHFWTREQYWDLVSKSIKGNTLAYYTLNPTTNTLDVRRDTETFFDSSKTYRYGSFANVVVNNIAYLYAVDDKHGYFDIHVASVPVSTIRDQTTYKYYDNSNGQWDTSAPSNSNRRESQAILGWWQGFGSGSVFYSEYHNAYLFIFFTHAQDNKFHIYYSSTPVGPWKGPYDLYTTTTGTLLNDHGVATPVYYDHTYDNLPGGKEILLTYTHTVSDIGPEKYIKAIKIKFA
ncbi:hypothetical protein V1511DRAFT_247272 [Dipodascopsis uninucleata]